MSGRGDDAKTGATSDVKKQAEVTHKKTYNMVVDSVPYIVKATPYSFNEEKRYYVSINGGTDHVFTWDSELKTLRAIDDAAGSIPDALEEAISSKLQQDNT